MTIHQVTVEMDGETFHFASLDGDHFLPVNRLAEANEPGVEKSLAKLFEGDGNFKPLVFARRWFDIQKADGKAVTFHDEIH